MAENKLASKVNDGDTTAIIFTLKTIGRERGYIERKEWDGNLKIDKIEVDID